MSLLVLLWSWNYYLISYYSIQFLLFLCMYDDHRESKNWCRENWPCYFAQKRAEILEIEWLQQPNEYYITRFCHNLLIFHSLNEIVTNVLQHLFYPEIGIWDSVTTKDKWFIYNEEEEKVVEKYISSLR